MYERENDKYFTYCPYYYYWNFTWLGDNDLLFRLGSLDIYMYIKIKGGIKTD